MDDVCLIIEGCYPFVTGGVAQWIQMLIETLDDMSFSLLVISPDESPKEIRYQLPPNVSRVVEIGLEADALLEARGGKVPPRVWEAVESFHQEMAAGDFSTFAEVVRYLRHPGADGALSPRRIFEDNKSWELLSRLNQTFERLVPFIEYLHSWRSTHLPILRVLRAEIPPARVYHTISTGYAGLLGAVAKIETGAPLLMVEHGIYTKEREMEIMRADWIAESQKPLWVRYFNALGQIAYHFSDKVIALFEINRKLQVSLGAPDDRSMVIPNGIDIDAFTFPDRPKQDDVFRVGTVGRITPIKDTKTFIKACALVARKHPKARFYVLGPAEESPTYYEECRFLARDLGIDRQLEFPGKVNVRDWYPKLDVFVLSSVREAQPLTVIEAMCAGIPIVATRVGSVPELVENVGSVVNPKRPSEMAEAICRYIEDGELREHAIEGGKKRARDVYDLRKVTERYRKLYRSYIDATGA